MNQVKSDTNLKGIMNWWAFSLINTFSLAHSRRSQIDVPVDDDKDYLQIKWKR